MFVGHAALAFALGVLAAERLGWPRDRVLVLGVVAGLFAAVPDVDVLHAVVDVPALVAGDPADLPTAFWTRSAPVHRAMTHSLVVAGPAALAFGLWARSRRDRTAARPGPLATAHPLAPAAALPASLATALRAAPSAVRPASHAAVVAVALSAGLVAVALAASGPVGGTVMAAFCAAGLAVASVAARLGLGWRPTAAAALVGLASHPFGDLFTGEPPALLYPLDVAVPAGRVGPFADPTLDLLLAFGVELAAVWLGVLAAARLFDRRPSGLVARRAAVGAGYALAVPVLPAPTLDVSYQFVYSVLAVGAVGAAPAARSRRLRLPPPSRAAVTGLAAVTLAWVAFAVVHVAG